MSVIEDRLRQAGIEASVEELDVYALGHNDRTAVLDTLIAERTNFPMVLVAGVVASHDGIDLDAIVRTAREVSGRAGCC